MTNPLVPSTTEDFIAEELTPLRDFHAFWTHRARAHELTAESFREQAKADRIVGDSGSVSHHLNMAADYEQMAESCRQNAQGELA